MTTTQLNPADPAQWTDEDLAQFGLGSSRAHFDRLVQSDITNGDSLAIRLGTYDDHVWRELVRDTFGPDGDRFFENIGHEDGKLATALAVYGESIVGYQQMGDDLPEGPRRYTGGVVYRARVLTEKLGWLERDFAGAASGVQGHFDMATVYAGLLDMAGLWALQMIARHGKG